MPAGPEDFLPPPPAMPEPTLFDSPSIAAGRVAARYARTRYRQILQHLRDKGPACIFEIAAALSDAPPGHQVFDHQISGRFSALEKDLLILRTGHTKPKPDTGCKCSLYQITTLGLALANTPAPPSPPAGGDA